MPNSVESFDYYSQPLYDLLESLDINEKVILVVHSMGGTTVARATERYPHKIHVAVYLAAAMYTSGMSQTDIHDEVFSEITRGTQFHFDKGAENPPTSCWPSLEIVTRAYYSCCSAEDIGLASKFLRPVPCMCDDATKFTEKGFYCVPRV